MKSTTILLVEDNPDDELLTVRALKKNNLGNDVFVVRDGVQALDYLFCQNEYADRDPLDLPQLILLDIKLPKLNGLEVLRAIRADQRTRHLPVVMLTSSNEDQDLIDAYAGGANSFVRKPVDFAEFSQATQQLGLYWLVLNQTPGKQI